LSIVEGWSFWSLYRRIYYCKLQNEKKFLSKWAMNIHSRHLNCCVIVNLKTRRHSNTLKFSLDSMVHFSPLWLTCTEDFNLYNKTLK
jgi:hypothetical protein